MPEVPVAALHRARRGRAPRSRSRSGAPCPTTSSSVPSTRSRPPVVLDFDPPKALGRAVFDVTYEGAPGCVHGAVLAATFDIILTAANAIEGATGPTVRLALRYLRPTLTDEEAVFEGWVTEVTERRIFSKGRIVQGRDRHRRGGRRVRHLQHGTASSAWPTRGAHLRGRAAQAGGAPRRVGRRGRGGRRRRRPSRWGSSRPSVARLSLQPSRDPADYTFAHRLRTRFAETDAMGIIHHAAYLPYLEEARVEYLRAIGHPYDAVRAGDDGDVPGGGGSREFPVLEVSVQYRRPLRFDDEVDVSLRVGAVTRHHVPDRLPAVGRRRGQGDGGDRARVRRRARPPGAAPDWVVGSSRRRARGARRPRPGARRTPPWPAWPRPGRRPVPPPCPACMMAPRRRCESGSTADCVDPARLGRHAEHGLERAEGVALVELVPGVPAEDGGAVEHHDALHLGVDALVQERVETQLEDPHRIGLAPGGRALEDLRCHLVLDGFERRLEQVGLARRSGGRGRRGSPLPRRGSPRSRWRRSPSARRAAGPSR